MTKYEEQFRRTQDAQRRMEQRIEESCRRLGHGKPVTRRDFLSRGLIAGTSTVFLPSLATVLSSEAKAACELPVNNGSLGAGKIPFIAIDQAGGANIAGANVIVGGAGGQADLLPEDAYETLGLPTAISPQNVGVNQEFGIAMHPDSALLRGMLDKTTAATRANVNGSVIPARSENDTRNNPHNPIYGIAKAGASGEFVATIGTRNTITGGPSKAPEYMIDATLAPTTVSNRKQAISLSGGEASSEGFPSGRIAQATAALNQLKMGSINEQEATKELIQCGFDQTVATFNSPISPLDLDPETDAALLNIFPNGEITTDKDFIKAAATMKIVINGYGGAGTIEMGRRDYHAIPRPETDAKDFKTGQVIGAALEYAAAVNKPLMIYTFSDGAVSADLKKPEDDGNGVTKYRWRADNSVKGASLMLVYSPTIASAGIIRNGNASQQLGNYTQGGTTDTNSSPYANSVTSLAELCVLNYLALHGEQANFANILGTPTLGANPGVEHIAFNQITA